MNDARVLIPGGTNFQGGGLSDAELHTANTAGGAIDVSGGLHAQRVDHKTIILPDGTIPITGGIDGVGELSSGAEIYNPATQRLIPTQTETPMTRPRRSHRDHAEQR